MFDKLDYIDNILHYDRVNLIEIAQQYKTPIYVYSKDKIISNYFEYKKAFEKFNIKNYQISYAVKANSNLSILKILNNIGSGIDAVSIGEIKKAILAGFSFNKIVFSGVGKTKEELYFAIQNRVGQINIESYEEYLLICNIAKELNIKANVSIRINPNIDANTHDKITTGKKDNKFGVNINITEKIIHEITTNEDISHLLNFNGISVHIGSQILDLQPIEETMKLLKSICKKYYNIFKTIDFGGGIGIQYNSDDKKIKIQDYIALIVKYFNDFNGKIIIEPGRSIIGNAGIFLTKIVRIKKTDNCNFIVVDGGMNNLIRPAMYEAFHYPMIVKKNNNHLEKYSIVGPICESSDVFVNNFEFNNIEDDDNYIAFLCSGAYGSSMSSNYNLHDLAGEILIYNDENGKKNIKEIKKSISFYDLMEFENI